VNCEKQERNIPKISEKETLQKTMGGKPEISTKTI